MRIKFLKSSSKHDQEGFTLIELALCILIVGFMMIPLADFFQTQQLARQQQETIENINSASSEVSSFKARRGRLPCPADRTLNPGDANFGLEQNGAGIPACNGTMQGICRTAGARDTDIDGDGADDPVLIGGLPVVSMRNVGATFSDAITLDAWGNRLTYAVSERLCPNTKAQDSRDFRWGVIEARDEFGNRTAGIGASDLSQPPDGTLDSDGQFVVISHGPTARGAFSASGGPVQACDNTTVDGENCDNDFVFASALGNYQGAGANFFDDHTYFHLYKPSALWDNMSILVGPTPSITAHIQNLNTQNIGVLTDTPQTRLHVAGDIRADSVKTPRLCDETGANCFDYDWFGPDINGSMWTRNTNVAKRNTCTGNEVITSIGNGRVWCGKPTLQPPSAGLVKCVDLDASKPYLRGIKSNGDPICSN
ncbi:MAG: prepilin-type N-terminal cleavage/methylation domain-containing protein [Alphaproteobacteria bacterium]|nr:prepilin-type N-terminal cleavage/methylation domain-containing protein [Alphaproteobacteria bacterium]